MDTVCTDAHASQMKRSHFFPHMTAEQYDGLAHREGDSQKKELN